MSALPIPDVPNVITITPQEYGTDEWHFKKAFGGATFWINEDCKGKITKIDTIKKDSKIVVYIGENESHSTTINDPTEFATLSKTLTDLMSIPPFRMMARMLATMNGRCNFELYKPVLIECPKTCQEITREKLLKMLKRENEIRLSSEMLEILEMEARAFEDEELDESSCNQVHIPWSIVKCQEKAVEEFGYKSNAEMNYALQMLRSARALFPSDIEIKNAAFYLKYNRAHRGELRVGDTYKDVPLMTCREEETKLSKVIDHNKPVVMISGSIT